jgi:hypothetical protein
MAISARRGYSSAGEEGDISMVYGIVLDLHLIGFWFCRSNIRKVWKCQENVEIFFPIDIYSYKLGAI